MIALQWIACVACVTLGALAAGLGGYVDRIEIEDDDDNDNEASAWCDACAVALLILGVGIRP